MNEIVLPDFKHIDIGVGLKYLNNNRELYLKILKNFLNRYRDLDLTLLEERELKDTIHSIKGLSSTLGMMNLSKIATTIHENKNFELLPNFSKNLSLVIDELKLKLEDRQIKTILLIDDKIIDIDILIELLGDKYDIAVALDERSAIEILDSEDISVVMLDIDINLDIEKVYSFIASKQIPTLFIIENIESKERLSQFYLKNEFKKYIIKPFNLKKIEKSLKEI